MARSKNINTYHANERLLLSPVVVEKMPLLLGGFSTQRQASAARMNIYGLLGAARATGTELEKQMSYCISTTGIEQQENGTWGFYLINRDDVEANDVAGEYLNKLGQTLKSIGANTLQPPRRQVATPGFAGATLHTPTAEGGGNSPRDVHDPLGIGLTPTKLPAASGYAATPAADAPAASLQLPDGSTITAAADLSVDPVALEALLAATGFGAPNPPAPNPAGHDLLSATGITTPPTENQQ